MFKDIINLFKKSSKDNFPIEECTISAKENGIFESNRYFLCLMIDTRFKGEFIIRPLRPYIWKDNKSDDTGYAWLDENGNYYDNFDNPIHIDDLVVVGFKEMDYNDEAKKFISDYWEEIKEVEESYYE